MAKSLLKLQARELRKFGMSIKSIANKLHVSTSSASLWCRDIDLTVIQRKKLEKQAHDPYYGKRLVYIERVKKQTDEKITKLKREGIKDVGNLTRRDIFVGGICLYWAEGFKKDNLVGFANSDPRMIEFFIRWLHDCCGVQNKDLRFRITLNESYKNNYSDVMSYWTDRLGIEKTQFQKPFFQKVKWQKIYENRSDYHGVLRVRVACSITLLRKIYGWIEGVQVN